MSAQSLYTVIGKRQARGKTRAFDAIEGDHARDAVPFRSVNLEVGWRLSLG